MEGDKLRRHLIQFFRWQLEQGYIDTEDKMYVPYEVAEKYLDERGIDYDLSASGLLRREIEAKRFLIKSVLDNSTVTIDDKDQEHYSLTETQLDNLVKIYLRDTWKLEIID